MALVDRIGIIEDVHGMSPWIMSSIYSLLEQRGVNILVLNGDNVDSVQITEDTYNKFGDLEFCRSLGMDVDNKPLLGRHYQKRMQEGEQSQERGIIKILEALGETDFDVILNIGNHEHLTTTNSLERWTEEYDNITLATEQQFFEKEGYDIVIVPGSHMGGQVHSNYETKFDVDFKFDRKYYLIDENRKMRPISKYIFDKDIKDPEKIPNLLININMDPIKEKIKDPKKTILFTHDPSKGEHKTSPDIAHFVEEYKPVVLGSEIKWKKTPGFIPVGQFMQHYQQNPLPFVPLQHHEEDWEKVRSTVKEMEKSMLGDQPDPRRLQPIYIERETNVGEKFIKDFKEETGIEKEFCGHIHGTSGIAIDNYGRKVEPNNLTENIHMNAGTLDGGYLTIIDVYDDGKVSYQTLDWREEIGVPTVYSALQQNPNEMDEILSEYKGENICDLIIKHYDKQKPIPLKPKAEYLDDEKEQSSRIILPFQDLKL